ncbi:MAG: dynamin family protein, partial [Muribaculaceae bacterium]
MKKVQIKYNPYQITTLIMVDGKAPKSDSALNVPKLRLQEWVERLPQILIDEYRDCNFEIDFTGTETDYNDVVAAIEAYGTGIRAKCKLHATKNIDDVESTIDKIWADIQAKEDVPELRAEAIVKAFEKAKDSRFEINVVATMSSGKSTLINALLGQQLMPAANEATTATIVKIVDTESDHFSAVAYDKSGNKVETVERVTLEVMKKLNADERISAVEILGKIPFVKSTGMKLVLVDTPGPNNSRDEHHKEMTYGMIANSDKSLVLFVMNGTQLGINDEKLFLDYICEQMAKGGKQSRERFIFAVNKMDSYKPNDKGDGVGCIIRALQEAKKGLEARGIHNPNLFPVASLPALQLRELEAGDDDDDAPEYDTFKKRSRKYEEMRFEGYYDFSNLPQSVKRTIDQWLEAAAELEGDTQTEIHTGIVSIEQAICMYVNKYARTQKVMDLVQSFNGALEEMAAIASVQDRISKDKAEASKLQRQIEQIQRNIDSARQAKTTSKEIDKIDLVQNVEREVSTYLENVRNKINSMMSGKSRVTKSEALTMCKDLENQAKAITMQIKVEMDKILDKAYKTTLTKIVDEYKKHLAALNMGVSTGSLTFNPMSLVSASLANLTQIMNDNTETKDEGHYTWATRRKEGGFLRKAASFFTFGLVDDYTVESYKKWVPNNVSYVEMADVARDYLEPLQASLKAAKLKAVEHITRETARLKEH